MRIRFFSVGGTIDKVYFDALSKYQIGQPCIRGILKDARVNFVYDVKSLMKKDSLDMTDQDRQSVLEAVLADDCDHIVITHGTDTMIETAKVLKKIPGKVIVLTGAMEPACFKTSDAPFNLGFAISAVQTLTHGVYIAISGRIFDPDKTRKDRDLKQFQEEI
ncbi:MAG: asparaginase domain-containing protein [Pseudomonadota bacterium]